MEASTATLEERLDTIHDLVNYDDDSQDDKNDNDEEGEHLLGNKMLIFQPLSHLFYSTSGDTLNLLLICIKVPTKKIMFFLRQ